MFLVANYTLAVLLCVVTMLCWGSWGNSQKAVGKTWRFELFYWDYTLGVFLMSLIFAFTLGSNGGIGRGFMEDIAQASQASIGWAVVGGSVFNIANILLVAAIAIAGMSVAFPVGIGLALVLGVVLNYIWEPSGNAALLFTGVALVTLAIILNAVAYGKMVGSSEKGASKAKGLLLAIFCGILMALWNPFLVRSLAKIEVPKEVQAASAIEAAVAETVAEGAEKVAELKEAAAEVAGEVADATVEAANAAADAANGDDSKDADAAKAATVEDVAMEVANAVEDNAERAKKVAETTAEVAKEAKEDADALAKGEDAGDVVKVDLNAKNSQLPGAKMEAGKMSPYTGNVVFSLGVLLSTILLMPILMAKPIVGEPVSLGKYFTAGTIKDHSWGIIGGFIWAIGTALNVSAAGTASPAVAYGLGQGATLVAAIWGVFIWKEFKDAPASAKRINALMFVLFIVGLALIILTKL